MMLLFYNQHNLLYIADITAQKLVVFVMNLMGTNSTWTQAEVKIIRFISVKENICILNNEKQ